jgi:putative sterol carrier protein
VEPVPAGEIAGAADYFARLAARAGIATRRGHDAAYLFDIESCGKWLVELRDGNLSVRQGEGEANLVLHASEDTFLRIVRGEQNPQTAVLSGKVRMQGEVGLAPQLGRLMSLEAG